MICPSCRSKNIRVIDKGWKFLYRFATGNNRYMCNDCTSTWRRRMPNQLSKVKRKRLGNGDAP
jgi:transposase-like protein